MSERSAAPGDLALVESLVNTLDVESGADALDTAQGRATFGITEDEAAHARELRESLRAALLAHAGHPPHRAVTPLGDLLAAAPLLVTVDAHDGSARLAPAPGGSALLARTATAVAQALVEGTWTRLKACEAVTCHWAYYDRSPAGRGRWCSMQVCGARAKMRRYRSK
ncbi:MULTISPECIES: CGNR zinc finger domain-containing protein [unclassified Streptomyces]|uniref:CGNR zinc finger domain-containing protein n=1 Tax=unclassified Streptomyces TaxID=2593676 RepID=UPI0029AD1F48|nr:CGNR zinc finger domain-containing protein [Streptomyces sp. FL07-04A]MDX3578607.1 CGNR zinc finger domain-containing protein [Streptomyces sp. FL07-04A]